jgi:hypothetical protein
MEYQLTDSNKLYQELRKEVTVLTRVCVLRVQVAHARTHAHAPIYVCLFLEKTRKRTNLKLFYRAFCITNGRRVCEHGLCCLNGDQYDAYSGPANLN